MSNAANATNHYNMEVPMTDAEIAYEAACLEAAFGEDYDMEDAVMEFTVSAVELMDGDVIVAGHGYGEKPQEVLRSGRFTGQTRVIQLQDGNRHRIYYCAPDDRFTIQR
jgi:hypothetical protein